MNQLVHLPAFPVLQATSTHARPTAQAVLPTAIKTVECATEGLIPVKPKIK